MSGSDDTHAAAFRHVVAFNAAVGSGDWADFALRFAPDAVMTFIEVPAGPFVGRAAIAAAYAAQPPTDTMTVESSELLGPDQTRMRFRWSAGGTGTMTIRFDGGEVAALTVAFD